MPQPALKHATIAKRGIPKPMSSPGGKEAWRDIIKQRVPDHRVYVEPYAGSATVFFAKAERAEIEVLSDTNPEIVAVYMFLRDGSDTDFEWMRAQSFDPNADTFQTLKGSKPRGPRQRAYRAKYLNLHSRRGDSTAFNAGSNNTGAHFKRDLEKFRERLEGVQIFNADALEVIKRFDSADTFFYLDPPWKAEGIGEEWANFDGKAFAAAAKALVGKTLISYQGDIDLGEDWRQVTIAAALGGIGKRSVQHLLINYEPPTLKVWGEAGAHTHGLDRPNLKTHEAGGTHQHIFAMPDGSLLASELDGQHEHTLASSAADMTGAETSKHSHKVIPLEGDALVTAEDGEHSHETQSRETTEGGTHTHILAVGGSSLKSLSAGEFWARFTVRNSDATLERFFKSADPVQHPFPDEHVATVRNVDAFTSFARKSSEFAGIDFVLGSETSGAETVQAVHFDTRKYTPAAARAWLEAHELSTSGFAEATKAADFYPPDRKPQASKVHLHFEGDSSVLAFRFKCGDRALGWSLGIQRPGLALKSADPGGAVGLAQAFSITGTRYYRPLLDSRVLAAKGAHGGGTAVLLTEGQVEYGLQHAHEREYFLGKSGALGGTLTLTAEYNERGECAWVASLSKTAIPRVLTTEAVAAGRMPPDGISALPEAIEKMVPAEFRYWTTAGDEAREVRDALVAKGEITEVIVYDGELRAAVTKRFLAPIPTPAITKSLARLASPTNRAMRLVQTGKAQPMLIAEHLAAELGTDDLVAKLRATDRDYLVAWPDSCHARTAFNEIGRPFTLKHGGGGLLFVASQTLRDSTPVDFADTPFSLDLFSGVAPGEVPAAMRKIAKLYDDVIHRTMPIVQVGKRDAPDEQFVLSIVLEPEVVDAQKDIYSGPEIRKGAHGWMEFHRNRGYMHKEVVNDKVVVLESYTALVDMEIPLQVAKSDGSTTRLIKQDTWLMGYGIRDADMWNDIKVGKLNGLSIGGTAERRLRED